MKKLSLALIIACCSLATSMSAAPNDRTTKWVNIEQVKNGTGAGLTQAFTGKGVIVGILDIGFDLTHPTFYATDGKTYRIKRFVDNCKDADTTKGHAIPLGREYRTEEEILDLKHSGDSKYHQHGTHVLGIAAGSGYGTPYQGMAPDADICAICVDLTTEYTTNPESPEFKYIFDYADEQGKPCVINYSMGTGYNPKTFYKAEQAFKKMLGPGHIIVAGAGNSGAQPYYTIKKRGVAAGGVFLKSDNQKNSREHNFISNDPFVLKVIRVKGIGKQVKGDSLTFDSQNLPAAPQTIDIYQAQMTKSDSIYTLSLKFTDPDDFDMDGSFMLLVEGKEAQVRIIADVYTSIHNNTALDPRCNLASEAGSILAPSCFADILSVGNIVGRRNQNDTTADIPADPDGVLGVRNGTSSVGPTYTGITKPDVVAPGSFIISAGNSFSSTEIRDNIDAFTASEFNGKSYPWRLGTGTSQSTPVVSGIIALWLEAKPTLTTQEVLETIRLTSKPLGTDSLGYPNNEYGYGIIDAYKGLLHVLGLDTSIRSLSQHQPAGMTFRVQGDVLYADGAADDIPVTFYNLSGTIVRQSKVENGTVSLSGMSKGVYAVQLGNQGSTLIRK